MMTMLNDKILEGCNEEQKELMRKVCFEDDQNHTEETIFLLRRIIDIQPTVPYAFALLGSIYLDQAQLLDETYHYDKRRQKYIVARRKLYRDAIAHFEKAIALKPDSPGTILLLARACEQCSFLKRAVRYYDLYLTFKPHRAEIYYAKGMIYEYQQDYPTALALYEKALSFEPDNEMYKDRIMKLQKRNNHTTKTSKK
ncbi:tetratricopeptide repeat protein [Treponema sp. OMZ 857]|uniref:tetratricopeptide repeat protein n=1 Tax=Treponema sp. OMZ 857 TaxID=1643513 RepID=UPI0020A44836|nr:tetratricopeptide repeat protein [Treponema sp. OMZ 857]UTC43042.1 tetratricopeptide repeat protein [Treponema sp. OMZ 857]